jgi:hypothetical protein
LSENIFKSIEVNQADYLAMEGLIIIRNFLENCKKEMGLKQIECGTSSGPTSEFI